MASLNENQEVTLIEQMRRGRRSIQSAKVQLDELVSLFLATAQAEYENCGHMGQVEQIILDAAQLLHGMQSKLTYSQPHRTEPTERTVSHRASNAELQKNEQINTDLRKMRKDRLNERPILCWLGVNVL